MMVLDFIQSKLFSNYQPPKPFTPPKYRPPVASTPQTGNQASQNGQGETNTQAKTNPFQLEMTKAPVMATAGAAPIATLGGISGVTRPEAVLSKAITGNNPFLLAQTDPAKQLDQLGKNRPFAKPIFLGYRDNQALYGASKLFVLC
jgi:hypothetical protein